MSKTKKLETRISEELKQRIKNYCKSINTDVSKETINLWVKHLKKSNV
jgi:antitoxin component of RelBE/YafQ-DinJ toxin-antitoxin module